jgi:heptosyltransferase-1
MGDVLHALPAVALLRRTMPGAHIGWVVEQRWRELLCAPGTELAGPPCEGRPLLNELHLVDTRGWRKRPFSSAVRREFLSAFRLLRARRYDSALDLQGAIKSALLARLSGARLVLGFRQPREALARWVYDGFADNRTGHVPARTASAPGLGPAPIPHVIDQNIELVQTWLHQFGLSQADITLPPGAALLPRHPASEVRIEAALQSMGPGGSPIAILNPGAGWGAKQWAPSRYGELAVALAARGLCSLVNFGPGEQALADEVVSSSRGAAKPLATTLSEFIALARRAHLFVGGDTGPMHLAALLGVKTVALFGPTDPDRNGPYWPGSRVLRDPASIPSYSHKRTLDPGLEKLTVERVLAEVDALL